jgi:hypothetical protein
MRIRFNYITPLLVAGAAAAAIAAAPAASADPMSCVSAGGATQCQTPGNVQINATPPVQTAGAFGYGGYGGGCTTPYGTYQNCVVQQGIPRR